MLGVSSGGGHPASDHPASDQSDACDHAGLSTISSSSQAAQGRQESNSESVSDANELPNRHSQAHVTAEGTSLDRDDDPKGDAQPPHSYSHTHKDPLLVMSPQRTKPSKSASKSGKILTLRDYVDASKPKKSPRGVDLELIKATPREEDLTKIKFARFVFDGVKTSVLSRTVKHLDSADPNGVVTLEAPEVLVPMGQKWDGEAAVARASSDSAHPSGGGGAARKGSGWHGPSGLEGGGTGGIKEAGDMLSSHSGGGSNGVRAGAQEAVTGFNMTIEEDIDRLKKLSGRCIEQIGLQVGRVLTSVGSPRAPIACARYAPGGGPREQRRAACALLHTRGGDEQDV